MKLNTFVIATAIAVTGTISTAQDTGDISVGVGVTNFGLSLQGEYAVNSQASVRGMLMGGLNPEGTFEADEATIDGQAELGGIAVVGDYYPMANAWRVSAGLFVSNSEVTGQVTSGAETYEGSIGFKSGAAPLITTGFNAEIAAGWSFSGDIGVIVSSLEVSSDTTDPDEQNEIDNLNADLEDIPVFPFVGLSVSYSY